jgi:hypothetical protein
MESWRIAALSLRSLFSESRSLADRAAVSADTGSEMNVTASGRSPTTAALILALALADVALVPAGFAVLRKRERSCRRMSTNLRLASAPR